MFLLNIENFNIITPDFPYTSENETKCTILYQKFRNFKMTECFAIQEFRGEFIHFTYNAL